MNNPNGWIPGSVLQLVVKEIPKGVRYLRNFIDSYGPPPAPIFIAGTLESSDFDNDTSAFK